MMPPRFRDWQRFIQFRAWLKKKLYIKRIVKSNAFESVVIVVIVANFILVMISFFQTLDSYSKI